MSLLVVAGACSGGTSAPTAVAPTSTSSTLALIPGSPTTRSPTSSITTTSSGFNVRSRFQIWTSIGVQPLELQTPLVAVYSDGTVVVRAHQDSPWQVPRLLEAQLVSTEVVLAGIEAMLPDAETSYGYPTVSDDGWSLVTLDGQIVAEAYALRPDAPQGGLTADQLAARDHLFQLIMKLWDPEWWTQSNLVSGGFVELPRGRVVGLIHAVGPAEETGDLELEWPLTEPPFDGCNFWEGEDALLLAASTEDLSSQPFWRSGDLTFTGDGFKTLLPDEVPCDDEGVPRPTYRELP